MKSYRTTWNHLELALWLYLERASAHLERPLGSWNRAIGSIWKSLIIALLSALVLTGCASPCPLQVAEHVARDTVYINKLQYDSIYVSRDHFTDRTLDTVYLRDVSVEYRYKLLRDTIYKTRIDSIPYEVRVVETKVERHIPWYAKLLSWIGTLALLFLLIRVLRHLRVMDFP